MKSLFALVLSLLFASCGIKKESITASVQEVNFEVNSELVIDTIVTENYDLVLRQTDTSSQIVEYPTSVYFDEKNILPSQDRVERSGDSLIFRSDSGMELALVNVPYDEESEDIENIAIYSLNRDYPKHPFWEVNAYGYEFSWTVIIDKRTLERYDILGTAEFSPKGRFLLSTNIDLEAAFTTNGIELYENEEGRYVLMGHAEFESWGLGDIKWISDTHFEAKKYSITENYQYRVSDVVIDVMAK